MKASAAADDVEQLQLGGMAGYKYARTPTAITVQIVLPPGTVIAPDRIVVPAQQAPK